MNEDVKQRLQKRETHVRALFMLLFFIILEATKLAIIVLTIFQSAFVILTGQPNGRLLILGRQLADYVRQIIVFLTFNHEQRPFPFSAWPSGDTEHRKDND